MTPDEKRRRRDAERQRLCRARMRAITPAGQPGRPRGSYKLTPEEQQWLADNWLTSPDRELAHKLGISVASLHTYKARLGLPDRPKRHSPEHMAMMRAGAERIARDRAAEHLRKLEAYDAHGERVSLPPGVVRFACPGCGLRAESQQGHPQCQGQQAA